MPAWWTLRKLRSKDYQTRERAKEKLVKSRAIEPLIAALRDEQSSKIALEALIEIGDSARQELVDALGDHEQRVRNLSAIALAELADPRSIPVLVETVGDPGADPFSRAESIRLLGKLKVEDARDRIRALLNEPGLGQAAASALADFGAFEDLLIAAQAGHVSAIGSLASLGDPRAFDPLVQILTDDTREIRTEAAKALGELRDPRATEPLLKHFHAVRSKIRQERPDYYGFLPSWVSSARQELAAVVSSLGKLRDERAHEPIINLVGDERDLVQHAIASGNSSCLHGSDEILKCGVRAIAEYGDSNDIPGIVLLIALMERGERPDVEWVGGGVIGSEQRRKFWNVRLEAEHALRMLESRMARRQAERTVAATKTSSNSAVSTVIFRPGPAPADADRYCRQVFGREFDGRALDQWRIIGVQGLIGASDASALYRRMVVEGKLPYFGHECGRLECVGPDGIDVVALFFSQQEIEPAADEPRGDGNVSSGDLDKIAAYWRRMGKEWWLEQEESRKDAVCDQCNSTIAQGQGFLHGSYLLCERCCEDRLATDALDRLREDPNYFGSGLLEQARASANSAEVS